MFIYICGVVSFTALYGVKHTIDLPDKHLNFAILSVHIPKSADLDFTVFISPFKQRFIRRKRRNRSAQAGSYFVRTKSKRLLNLFWRVLQCKSHLNLFACRLSQSADTCCICLAGKNELHTQSSALGK